MISRWLMVMVLTIEALDSAGKVDNRIGESRSPTQIFYWNLQHALHQVWAYVCAFGLGLMVMIAMTMAIEIDVAMVLLMVSIVSAVL